MSDVCDFLTSALIIVCEYQSSGHETCINVEFRIEVD